MASRVEILKLTVDGLYGYLRQHLERDTVGSETIEAFRESRINGESFLELTDEELLEIIPVLGERKAVKRLIDSFNPRQQEVLVRLVISSWCIMWANYI